MSNSNQDQPTVSSDIADATTLSDLAAQLSAAPHLVDPIARARYLLHLQAAATPVIAAAVDAAVAEAVATHSRDHVAAAIRRSVAEVGRRITEHNRRNRRMGRPGRRSKQEESAVETYIVDGAAPVRLAPEREENAHPAYLCGRLASVLHDLELAATSQHTFWYKLFPQTVADAALALRWADTHATGWLKRLGPQRADYYRSAISQLGERIGSPGVLTGAENGNWFGLGFYHQEAATRRAAKARGELVRDDEV